MLAVISSTTNNYYITNTINTNTNTYSFHYFHNQDATMKKY